MHIRKIAFFRPNAVGDFVFALPALHALRRAFPEAEIVYLGRPWHAEFLKGRPGPVDRVVVVPPVAGLTAASAKDENALAVEDFVRTMRMEAFDLAIQAYGGGRFSNPFVKRLGARQTIGLCAEDGEPLDRCLRLRDLQHRRLQLLELVALVGADVWEMGLELQCAARDHEEADRVLPATPGERLVLLQPGATDPRRRWPPGRFAAVADQLAEEGMMVAIHGTEAEGPIVQAVLRDMQHAAIDLSGRVSLSGLCGLLARAHLLVSNDTGPLHLACALDTPAVGIYWLSNLVESAPLRQERHQAFMSTRVLCPVCQVQNLTQRCEHDVSFVDDVPVEDVLRGARDLLQRCHGAAVA
ncbi:MAG: glycosyltransferase family 9 protein [Aquabacterium sp.]